MTAAFTRTFEDKGDFAATVHAQTWLIARGFSVGAPQLGQPRGILWGYPRVVAGWSHLSDLARGELSGIITGDHLKGPVTIEIFSHAPAAARVAVRPLKAA
jgi:hypothetical protein